MTRLRTLSIPTRRYGTAAHQNGPRRNSAVPQRFSAKRRVASEVAQRYAGFASMLRLFHLQSAKYQGAPMKITYSHVDPEYHAIIEHEVARHAAKLNRILKRYAPDLVALHGSLEKTPRKTEFNFSLNLNLPTGTLHSTGVGADVLGSAKAAFAELEVQVKKHQAKLRKDYVWKRKRAIALPPPREASSSD
jgi:ribosome-associated translation inhibitor RaiA